MENLTCSFCNKEVAENFQFCPHCGEPLTELAKKIEEKRNANAQLKVIFSLIENVNDEKTINLLKEYVNKLKENI